MSLIQLLTNRVLFSNPPYKLYQKPLISTETPEKMNVAKKNAKAQMVQKMNV